jgi:hypothetical protein
MARGKSNQEKFYLANRNLVTRNKSHGGLGIREPELMNIAMGARLLWRLVTGRIHWWKHNLVEASSLEEILYRYKT